MRVLSPTRIHTLYVMDTNCIICNAATHGVSIQITYITKYNARKESSERPLAPCSPEAFSFAGAGKKSGGKASRSLRDKAENKGGLAIATISDRRVGLLFLHELDGPKVSVSHFWLCRGLSVVQGLCPRSGGWDIAAWGVRGVANQDR